jgi:glycosyltransferase involved in cell wall biosynthesis
MREWWVISDSRPIALDATYSLGGSLSGVGVYSREILYGLARAHPDEGFLFAYRSHRLLTSLRERLPANARRAWLRGGGIGPHRCRLFHSLNQRLDTRAGPRTVATFHDLFVISGEYSTPEFRARFAGQARGAAERADLIIAVSEFTARQVVDLLGVDRARVRVVHHGVRAPVGTVAQEEARENLILHVGAIQARKNVGRLVEAFERTPPGWRLVLAGSAGFGAGKALARVEQSGRRRDIEVRGYVGEAELEALYARARVFAFPSLDEGFGMPVLEAMARGVPVLTSRGSALVEVAGDAALLVDPSSSEQIAVGLQQLCGDAGLRRELRERGLRRSAAFRWEQAVAQTWDVYRELE